MVVNFADDKTIENKEFYLTPEIKDGKEISKAQIKMTLDSTYQINEIIDLSFAKNAITLKPFEVLLLRLF